MKILVLLSDEPKHNRRHFFLTEAVPGGDPISPFSYPRDFTICLSKVDEGSFGFEYQGNHYEGKLEESVHLESAQERKDAVSKVVSVVDADHFFTLCYDAYQNGEPKVLPKLFYVARVILDSWLQTPEKAKENPHLCLLLSRYWQQEEKCLLDHDLALMFLQFYGYGLRSGKGSDQDALKKAIDEAEEGDETAKHFVEEFEKPQGEDALIMNECNDSQLGDAGMYGDWYFYSPCTDLRRIYRTCVKKYGGCGKGPGELYEDRDGVDSCVDGGVFAEQGCNFEYYDYPGDDD